MMMTKSNLIFTMLIFCSLIFTACDKDDPIIPNEEELITTVNYVLTPADGGASVTLSYLDTDGDGPNAPVVTGGTLAANETYTGSLQLLNEAESPAESITEEIQEEDDEHQFFFQPAVDGLAVAYADMDGDGNPVGLITMLTTGDAASGTLTIILRHEPVKDAVGVVDGDITNAGGETDIQVTLPIDVQ